jgi:hypothetical protein
VSYSKIFLTACLCCCLSFVSYAQYRNGKNEIGLLLGGSNYFGDLAPEIVLKETKFSGGIFFKQNHTKFFSSRYQFAYGRIAGTDKNFKANNYRNLSFQTNIFELGYNAELNFLPFGMNVLEKNASTFVFAGFNVFMFNPKTRIYNGDKIELRDLGTEGQVLNNKRKYSLIQPSVTLGLGYKLNISDKWILGTELGFRKTFTDYLDDTKDLYADYNAINSQQGANAANLSQAQVQNGNTAIDANTMRGDKHLKDWYFIAGVTISYRFVTTFCNHPF